MLKLIDMDKDDKNLQPVFKGSAAAKCNLSLAVTGKRGPLHTLDMICVPLDNYVDEAEFTPSPRGGGPYIALESAIANFDGFSSPRFLSFFDKKLHDVALYFGVSGKLSLRLGVPLGAGLGGSSCCTVAAIKAIESYCASIGKNARIDVGFLLSLGSDVPAIYFGKACRVQGVGEVISPLDGEPPEIEIFVAKGGSDSAACYALYDKLPHGETPPPPASIDEAIKALRNDLTLPAETLNPNIRTLRERLQSEGKRVVMSGSGSAIAVVK